MLPMFGVEKNDRPTLVESISLSSDAGGLEPDAGLFILTGFEEIQLTQIHFHGAKSGDAVNERNLPLNDEITVF